MGHKIAQIVGKTRIYFNSFNWRIDFSNEEKKLTWSNKKIEPAFVSMQNQYFQFA